MPSLPDDLKDAGDRIIAALRARSPQKPSELATSAKVNLGNRAAFTRLLVKLAAAGQIERAGNGRGAIVTMPGKSPARREP